MPTAADQERKYEYLEPLVSLWVRRLIAAKEAKKGFNDLAQACNNFYSKDTGWIWKNPYRERYLGKIDTPQFRVSLNKAFEFVAIYGPSLYWRVPNRRIEVEDPVQLPPEIFGLTPDMQQLLQQSQDQQFQQQVQQNPNLMMQFQQAQQAQQMQKMAQDQQHMHTQQLIAGSTIMESYLDYSQREQPGGGLKAHGLNTVNEALVKGRGMLWPRTYQFPGSDATLTGLFHESVDDFLIDPDCTDPTLQGANWIALRHVDEAWKVEREFGHPRGSLSQYAHMESGESLAARNGALDRVERQNGNTKDLLIWYEVWSKVGVGPRSDFEEDSDPEKRMNPALSRAFDEEVGDYAYLVVAEDVPYPINATSRAVSRSDNDAIREMFAWRCAHHGKPFPSYLDGRWPCVTLDMYPQPNSAWPIPPMAPALGELITLNVLVTAYVEMAFQNRKLIIASLKSAQQDVEEAIRSSDNPSFVQINDNAHTSINEMIQYLQRPNMNSDLLDAIAYTEQKFNERTGLNETHYGGASTQSRSARDVAAKQEAAAVRPEYMQNQTAECMSTGATLEMQLAAWNVEGKDLDRLIGPVGARLWDSLITTRDPEIILRQWRCVIDAVDMRKPNREREFSNLSAMLGYTMPVLQSYAQISGDGEPINNFLQSIADSMEQDSSSWNMGQWLPPPPDPEQQQIQQQQQQLEMQTIQADLQIKMLEAQIKQIEGQQSQLELQQTMTGQHPEMQKQQLQIQLEAAKKQQEMQFEQIRKQLEMQFAQAQNQQTLQQREQEHGQKLQHDQASFVQDRRQDQAEFGQEMKQDQASFTQDRLQKHVEGSQDIRHQAMKNQLDVDTKREQARIQTAAAKAKPKPSSNGAKK